MTDVCGNCHAPDWIAGHYTQYDNAVELYNEKFAKPSKMLMDTLRSEGIITKAPFDDKVEWTFFFLWHHEGRRARMGASMMAPDYTQWHGFFEVADRFYNELVPEVRELGHGNKKVQAAIDSVLAMDLHRWKKGMSPEEMKMVRKFYKERYGQDAGKAEGAAVEAPKGEAN